MWHTNEELIGGDVYPSPLNTPTPITESLKKLFCGICRRNTLQQGYQTLPVQRATSYNVQVPYTSEDPPMGSIMQRGPSNLVVPSSGSISPMQLYYDTESGLSNIDACSPAPVIPFGNGSLNIEPQIPSANLYQQLQPDIDQVDVSCALIDASSPPQCLYQQQLQESRVQASSSTACELVDASSPPWWSYGPQQLHASNMGNELSHAQPMPLSHIEIHNNLGPQTEVPDQHQDNATQSLQHLQLVPRPNGSMQVQERRQRDIFINGKSPGKRGPFPNDRLRQETADCRKDGACLRCRHQRIRCIKDKSNPEGPCLKCQEASLTRPDLFPCSRFKIKDVRLFKPGQVPGHEWTKRWSNGSTLSNQIKSWADSEVKIIHVSEGYSKRSLILKVRRFCPEEGDQLSRSWYHDGVKKSVEVPPFALMELDEGKKAYDDYIEDSMEEAVFNIIRPEDELVSMTYLEAWKLLGHLKLTEPRGKCYRLLDMTFKLWLSIRLTTTSCFIVGDERLGMAQDILDSTNPTPGKIPVPPMLGAQLDTVLIHQIQKKLRSDVLSQLDQMLQNKKEHVWMVTYLVFFMLLHNAALITAHDASYARKHGMNRRFAREDKVREYHFSVKAMLSHFHYCNGGIYPLTEGCRDQDLRNLGKMTDEQIKFIHKTRKLIAEKRGFWQQIREERQYENDHYFLRQLYQKFEGGEETI